MYAPASSLALHLRDEPFAFGTLDVGDGHELYFEQCGKPSGLPIVFLHGGPGSGCSVRHRQMFDLERDRVVLFDQRGCGRSTPRGSVHHNTSAHLVADIERLRVHLGIERWLVVGGSWGAGLAVAYAAAHRTACLGLVLRGLFLGRASDTDWFFQQVAQLLPDAWNALAEGAPEFERTQLMQWLAKGVNSADPQAAQMAARAWAAWEQAVTDRRTPSVAPAPLAGDAAQAQVDKYRIQSHYMVNDCFWGDASLLQRAATLTNQPDLPNLPIALLHGRLDWICRPSAAWELHCALPHSRLTWVDGCGHSPFEPAMARAMTNAISHFAIHGQFANGLP